MLGTGDGQNQGSKAANKDNKKATDTKAQKPAAKDTAASSTGTVFAPTAALPVDPMINPYDLSIDTSGQSAAANQAMPSAPPVFAEPTAANAPANTTQAAAATADQPAPVTPVVSA